MTEGQNTTVSPSVARFSSSRARPWADIDAALLHPAGLAMSPPQPDSDGLDYDGVTFDLAERRVVGRSGRVTPTKNGLFTALWRRAADGGTRPLDESDPFDVVAIVAADADGFGVFLFSKPVLRRRGVVSGDTSVGKRGFRLYPAWVVPASRGAERSQAWQLESFINIGDGSAVDVAHVHTLLSC